jgi:hypothetical protein
VEDFASSRCVIAGSLLGQGAPEVHTPVPLFFGPTTCPTTYDTTYATACRMWWRHLVGRLKLLSDINGMRWGGPASYTPTYVLSHTQASHIGSWCPPGIAPHYVGFVSQ